MPQLCFAFLLCLMALQPRLSWAQTGISEDLYSAVILSYHRIGEDGHPETNLRTDQFDSHIGELTRGPYTIKPLPEIITALKNKTPLPPQTIAITFDDAFQSAYEHGMKKLLQRDIPFTVFYAEDLIGQSNQYIDRKTLKTLEGNKLVTLGIKPPGNEKLAAAGAENIRAAINRARIAHREHFKTEAKLFSYPYGEYSNAYQGIIRSAGFDAAFGLHSGASHSSADFYDLPRFSMTESFGDLDRFQLVTNALPLPMSGVEPSDTYNTKPVLNIGFSLPRALESQIASLSCFISDQPKPKLEIIGARIEIRPQAPIGDERVRINCTMPVPQESKNTPQRWRWLGLLLINAPGAPTL